MIFGVSARRTGCAIVGFDGPDIVVIERFGDLEPLIARMGEIAAGDRNTQFVVDLDQRGKALVLMLGGGPWMRYAKVAKERAELTTAVDVGLSTGSFRVGRGVRNGGDLARALSTVTKSVSEEGPESELVVALALALLKSPRGEARIW